jgi:DNA-directed RNA polymerase subunit RPC12/RpoP
LNADIESSPKPNVSGATQVPSNEYFRCPSCNAKLQFGKRPKSRVTCPRCGHQFDYKPPQPDAEAVQAAKPQDELGSTAAFGMALQEAAGESRHSAPVDETDETLDDFAEDTGLGREEEFGPAAAPLRSHKTVARAAKEPAAPTAPKPLSKRWRKWYKRSWLGNPSSAGWQIAAGYAGIGVLILVVLLCMWMRQLQAQAKENTPVSYSNIYEHSSSNVSHLVLTGVFSLGTLFCLPIPYWSCG